MKRFHVGKFGTVQIGERTDCCMVIRVTDGIHHLQNVVNEFAVGSIGDAANGILLPPHRAQDFKFGASTRKLVMRSASKNKIRSSALEGHGFIVAGSVKGGIGIVVGSQCFHITGVLFRADGFAALEHQMLKKVGETGFAFGFFFAPNMIPNFQRHDGSAVVFERHDFKAVG